MQKLRKVAKFAFSNGRGVMQLKKWAAVALLLGISACATVEPYQGALPESGPVATLTFVRGSKDGFGYSSSQDLLISDTGRCEDMKVAGIILWTTPRDKSTTVRAGEKTTLLSSTMWVVSTGYLQTSTPKCHKQAEFTPVAGKNYTVKLFAEVSQNCVLTVTDQSTGLPPGDLLIQDGASCVRDFQRAMAIK